MAASIESADLAVERGRTWLDLLTRRTIALSACIAAAAAAVAMLSLTAVPLARAGGHTPAAKTVHAAAVVHKQTGQAASVSVRADPRRLALSFLILPVGSAAVAGGATAKLRGRRRELRTLRALGWGRRDIRRQLLQEFALIAVAGSLAAALAAYLFEVVLGRRSPSGWELLAIPAAVAMTVAAAWWPVRRAASEAEPMTTTRAQPAQGARRQPWILGRTTRSLRSAPMRSALSMLVIATACGALGQELIVGWAVGGTLAGSLAGHAVAFQNDPIDTSAVVTVLVLAVVTIATQELLTAGQRAVEQRTLQAIGWSGFRLAALAAGETALLGFTGGVAGIVVDVAGTLAVAHHLPASTLVVAPTVVGAGILVSLAGVGLSAAWCRRAVGVTR